MSSGAETVRDRRSSSRCVVFWCYLPQITSVACGGPTLAARQTCPSTSTRRARWGRNAPPAGLGEGRRKASQTQHKNAADRACGVDVSRGRLREGPGGMPNCLGSQSLPGGTMGAPHVSAEGRHYVVFLSPLLVHIFFPNRCKIFCAPVVQKSATVASKSATVRGAPIDKPN